jgi:hypothetical protein
MGCSSSKESHDGDHHPRGARARKEEPDPAGAAIANYLPTTGPLTAKDYKSRLASSEGTQTLYFPHSRITIRYAFVSQRGYYPDCPDKANQDSLCIHTHFGGDPEQAFFGVFDGHGEHGTQCSQFAKDKVGLKHCQASTCRSHEVASFLFGPLQSQPWVAARRRSAEGVATGPAL